MARDLALVVNPSSGRGRTGRLIDPVLDRLRAGGATVEVLPSLSAGHATELAREASARHAAVVAMGGDGMVHLVANGLVGSGAVLGIVPTGTGNDFAVNLGYPRRQPMDACRALLGDAERAVDVGRIEGGPAFLCVAGGGFDSEVNRLANRIRWARGTLVYVLAVLRTLARFRPARFRVVIDGKAEEFEGMFVAAGNAGSYGGGMRIAPDASLDDGLLDVCIVRAMGRATLVGQLPRLFSGTHVRHPAIDVRRGREVRIEAERPFLLYADGEEIGPLPATLHVEPLALRVLVPPGGAAAARP